MAISGGVWLWYPGDAVNLPGKWKRSGANICFAYTPNSHNPVTGHAGGGSECMEYRLWWGAMDDAG